MSLRQVLPSVSPTISPDTKTLVRGPGLVIMQVVWVVVVLAILVVFVMGIPQTYTMALPLHPETRAGLQHLGLSPQLLALYIVILDSGTMLLFALFAALIFWRRSNDWMILFVGIMLLSTGMLYTAPAFEARVPVAVVAGLAALAEIGQVAFVYLFPDGRFVPRWTWLLLPPLLLWRPAMWGLVYLPYFLSLKRSGEDFYYIPQQTWDLLLLLALLLVGILGQMYRYRYHSTQLQRQQTKWLVLGAAVAVVVVGSYVLTINSLGLAQQGGATAVLVRLLGRTVNHLALLLIPLTLTLSILRYRLWDIDTLINRALVYTILTGMLALLYIGLVLSLQYLLRGLTAGNQLAIVGSTLAVATLSQPLRSRIQKGIDRRFYRQKYDAARTINAFSARLRQRTDVDLTALSSDLLTVVQETIQPTQTSLWIRPSEQPKNVSLFGDEIDLKKEANNR